MEETKTTLQKIVEQKADQIRIAIEQAIDDGAKIEKSFMLCVAIDNVFLQRNADGSIAIVLRFNSGKIAKVFEPSTDDLEKLAVQKRRELEEIEKQIKEKEAQE